MWTSSFGCTEGRNVARIRIPVVHAPETSPPHVLLSMGFFRIALLAALVLAFAAPSAQAFKTCSEPGQDWERATPAEAQMDAAKLQDAIDYGSTQASSLSSP